MGDLNRRDFLKASSASIAAIGMTGSGLAGQAPPAQKPITGRPVRLGFVGIGGRGSYHLDCALGMGEEVQVTALCDIDDRALYQGKRWVEEAGQKPPALYGDGREAYRALCEKEDLDCIICCTPWEVHTPCCVAAMKNGKNAVSEVPILVTLEEAWELVETYEKTGKWATIGLEGFGDLTLMNMVQKGLFGDVLHAEGGYVHDLRMVKYTPDEEPWRLQHSIDRNGNLYPDHPMARIMRLLDINHGDRFDVLVSMSTKAVTLNRFAAMEFGENSPYAKMKMKQGDVNVSLIHTAGGKMVTLNFDTNTPHPREFFRMQGSKGVIQSGVGLPSQRPQQGAQGAQGAPPDAARRRGRGGMIYIDGRSPVAHQWESSDPYYQEYEHPYLKNYKPKQRKVALRGHGGGGTTTPVNWDRLIAALRAGKITDWDVYDSVTSSAIGPISEKSVAGGSAPVPFPDFTKGKWQSAKRFNIEEIVSGT
jgi:predicted dehydrogenase